MKGRVLAILMAASLLTTLPTVAQTTEGEVRLFTPFPGLVVEAGSTATFTLLVLGDDGARAPLAVTGLPDDWSGTLSSGGSTIDQVAVGPSEQLEEIRLDVAVPEGTSEGTYEFGVTAGANSLALSVTVRAGVAGEVTLSPEFPGLRGPTDGDFTFRITVDNATLADVDLEFAGFGPEGWVVEATPSGQAQASIITVEAASSETVNIKATPPRGAQAGVYEVGMTASGEGVDQEVTVLVELIGEFSVSLTTPDQRLNAEVAMGRATEFPMMVVNDGTAPLVGISLSSRAPSGWEVSIDPEAIDVLAPGESTVVTASITPSPDALAGDYDLSFTASSETVSDSMSIRTTVNPSTLWGLLGVGLIALALAGLALVFRRFGRR